MYEKLRNKFPSGWHVALQAMLLLSLALIWLPAHARAQTSTNEEAQATTGEETQAASAEETQAATGEEAQEQQAAGKGIEELIINARKREENLQSVPIAVTALSGADLDTQNIDDALDIQFKVPNLLFGKGNFTGANLQIRGIGAAAVAASGEGGVGINLNTMPLATRLFEQEFYDVERIEVLRGPQGTIFGRNSTGGSFNIYTRKPSDEFESKGELTFGNFNTVKFNGAINIPVSDRFRMRLAGMARTRDGFIENLATNSDIDNRELYGLRGTFDYDFSDDTHASVMVSWFKEKDNRSRIGKQLCKKDPRPAPLSIGCTDGVQGFGSLASHSTLGGILETTALASVALPTLYPIVFTGPTSPIGPGIPVAAADIAGINPPDLRRQDSRFAPQYRSDEVVAMLDISHEWRDLTFRALAAFLDNSVLSRQDYNMGRPSQTWTTSSTDFYATTLPDITQPNGPGTPTLCFPGFGCFDSSWASDQSNGDLRQLSGEVRVVSDYDGPFNFTGGYSLTHSAATDVDYFVFFSGAEILARMLALSNPSYDLELRHFHNDTDFSILNAHGLFAEGYWDALDDLKVTLGLRYTHDWKSVKARSDLLDPSGQKTPYRTQTASWNEVTGRVSVDYSPTLPFTDSTLVYVSGSRGYKGGGFNPPINPIFNVPDTFDPEYIWAYELGTKNRFWENRIQANVTGFFYDYRNYQISKIVARTAVNENVDAYVWGLETEIIALPVDDLQINLAISYLGSRIRNGHSVDPADPAAGRPGWFAMKNLADGSNQATDGLGNFQQDGFEKNLEGNELPVSPDVQIQLGGQYTVHSRVGEFTGRIDYYWQDDMFGRMFNEVRDQIASWSQADASLHYDDPEGQLYVEFWVKNFTDNNDITGQYLTDASSGNFTNVFLLDPRTIGVTLGASF